MNKYIISCVVLMFPALIFADCPAFNALQYFCAEKNECNWQAPWYEGFTTTPTNDNKAVQFLKAQWGRQQDTNKGPGSSLCFYGGNKGGIIMLVQNSWGNVAMPNSANWTWTTSDGYPVKQCTVNCHFNYPQ